MRVLIVMLAVGLIATGCGRKAEPDRPEGARIVEPGPLVEETDDDAPLLAPDPDTATPGLRLEDAVDDPLAN